MEAVILAAGLGSRFENLNKPKGLLQPFGLNEPLIKRSVRILSEVGISKIILGVGYKSEMYVEFFKNKPSIILYKNPNFENGSSAETLRILSDFINDDFLLLESDLIYEKRAILSLLDNKNKDLVLLSEVSGSGDEVFVELRDDRVSKLSKKANDLNKIYDEFVGISKVCLESFKSFKFNARDYEELLIGFCALKIPNLIWCEIDNKAHLNMAESYIIKELKKEKK